MNNVLMGERGKGRLGLLLFVLLLGLLVGQFSYRYMTRANRINDEAVDLMNQGKYDSALVKLDEALTEDPQHYKANLHQGICLEEKHRWPEALQSYDRAATLQPAQAEPHFHKGSILWKLSRFEEAIRSLKRATELKTPYPEAWIILAECQYEIFLDQLLEKKDPPPSPAQAAGSFKTYLKQRPGAPDRKTVELKLEIVQNIERFPEVLHRRRQALESKAEQP